ncbi:MAG: peptidoglycan-binding protein [Proteobacteria bacterium]|nr:peptidoglycan-binding protein [Pseudomonadota bacterium]
MNRLVAVGFVCVVGLAMLFPGAAPAADIALVIGNHDYRQAPNAKSAAIDAREVAEALEDGGYDVTLGIDLDRREMRRALGRFAAKIANADKVVIYFSGHALRSDGVTYLAPVDQRNTTLVRVMMDGVPLDLVLRLARSRPGRSVVFIDAAQLKGFTANAISEPGLGSIDAGNDVLVVSAAAPGRAVRRREGRRSRFAREVVREFLSPGVRAMDAAHDLRRPAWFTGSVGTRLRLVSRGGGGGRIGGADTPAEIEAALRLGSNQRRGIQESLSLLGHDPRGIDGQFGPGSRTAIRLWQRANSLAETGYLSADQVTLLQSQSAEATRSPEDRDRDTWATTGALGSGDGYRDYLGQYSDGLYADDARDALKRMARAGTDAAARREREIWREAKYGDRPRDYRDYLRLYPTGIWQPAAQRRLAELTGGAAPALVPAPVVADPATVESDLGLTRTDRMSIEQRLNYLGFPPGAQDGFFDSSTRWAIEGYQRNRGHEATGYLDQPTLAAIMNETRDVRSGIVIDGAAILRGLLGGSN